MSEIRNSLEENKRKCVVEGIFLQQTVSKCIFTFLKGTIFANLNLESAFI